MVFGFIYKITFDNGKNYIGLTTSLEDRIKEHKQCAKSGNNRILYNALRKFKMEDTFELIKIDSANTQEELCQKEKYYIYQYNSYYKNGKGYNMTYGGDGSFGYKFTKKQRQKISEANKERFKDPEEIKKNSEAQKNYHLNNPEAAQKKSEEMKNYYRNNPEARQKISETQKQRFEDPKERQKCSEAQKERFEDPKERQKCSEAQKNYHLNNPEAAQKISQALKNYHRNNPEAAHKMSKVLKNYHLNNPEAAHKMSKVLKNYHLNNPEAAHKMSELKKNYYRNNPEAAQKLSKIHKKRFKNNPEAAQKISEAQKKLNKDNPEFRKKRLNKLGQNKPFDVFKKDGTFIKTFTYQFEAIKYLKEEFNINSNIGISAVLRGKRPTSAGFVFKYK